MSEFLIKQIVAGASAGCLTALDCGSGPGKYRAPVRTYASIDGFEENPRSDYHRVGDLLQILPTITHRFYDLVYALDVIEHLEKDQGFRLLEEMERIATTTVLIFTPYGFIPQVGVNAWQAHRSGWYPDDFRLNGYMVAILDFDHGKGIKPASSIVAIKMMR